MTKRYKNLIKILMVCVCFIILGGITKPIVSNAKENINFQMSILDIHSKPLRGIKIGFYQQDRLVKVASSNSEGILNAKLDGQYELRIITEGFYKPTMNIGVSDNQSMSIVLPTLEEDPNNFNIISSYTEDNIVASESTCETKGNEENKELQELVDATVTVGSNSDKLEISNNICTEDLKEQVAVGSTSQTREDYYGAKSSTKSNSIGSSNLNVKSEYWLYNQNGDKICSVEFDNNGNWKKDNLAVGIYFIKDSNGTILKEFDLTGTEKPKSEVASYTQTKQENEAATADNNNVIIIGGIFIVATKGIFNKKIRILIK